MVLSLSEMKQWKARKARRTHAEIEKVKHDEICPYPNCAYIWKSRTAKPVSCPRCKRRLDNVPKVPEAKIGNGSL